MSLNVELLEQIKVEIRAHPTTLSMGSFFSSTDCCCGTTACICGWGVAIHNEIGQKLPTTPRADLRGSLKSFEENIRSLSAEAFGVPFDNMVRLFYGPAEWPPDIGNAYIRSEPFSRGRAEAVCLAIDWFIREGYAQVVAANAAAPAS